MSKHKAKHFIRIGKSKKRFGSLTSRSSVMSTFSAPSKPHAFQLIKAESVKRPRCWKVCRTIEKNRTYFGSSNSMETIRYYIKFGTTIVRLRVQDQYMASLKFSEICEERREAVNELIIWAINRFKLV